jgi:hypothetical protein
VFTPNNQGGLVMKRLPFSIIVGFIFLTVSVFIPNAICANQIRLRSEAAELSDNNVKSMLIKYNFFDRTKNKNGNFINELTDNDDGTISDRATGLMWQKEGSQDGVSWVKAKEYINKLNSEQFLGYSNWRLPTIEELASLLKSKKANNKLHIDPIFSETQPICWSSDIFAPEVAWYVNFKSGMIRHIYLFFYHVRAVRTIK